MNMKEKKKDSNDLFYWSIIAIPTIIVWGSITYFVIKGLMIK
jgi:hypothetical protein